MYIYYPSCNFKRLFPETAERIRLYMESQSDVRVAGCCKATNDIPKEGDTIVTVCMTCMRLLSEVRKDIPNISLFEFMLTRGDFAWKDHSGEKITLVDCFRARGRKDVQDAARGCLKKLGFEVIEAAPARDEADFDGAFLLRPVAPINQKLAPGYFADYLPEHLTPLPEEEWQGVFEEMAGRIGTDTAAGYCNTCVPALNKGGKKTYHIAELLFG